MSTSDWQKSSFSSGDGNTNCIEVAAGPRTRTLRLRESDEPANVVAPTGAALSGLIRHLKAGEARTR